MKTERWNVMGQRHTAKKQDQIQKKQKKKEITDNSGWKEFLVASVQSSTAYNWLGFSPHKSTTDSRDKMGRGGMWTISQEDYIHSFTSLQNPVTMEHKQLLIAIKEQSRYYIKWDLKSGKITCS